MKHRKRKILLVVVVLLTTFAALLIIPNGVMYGTTKKMILLPDDQPQADCILILGAGIRPDGSPSKMLIERLETGYRLYASGKSERILCSGDHGREDYDEVGTMKRYLMDKGVPDSAIFMDHAGFSTYDSLYRAKYIFGCESLIVVTQRYHLYRGLYIGQALGISCTGADAQTALYRGQTLRDLREAAARTKDFYKALFKPKAEIMGDEIPVSGDGSVTNDKAFQQSVFKTEKEKAL